MVYVGAVMVLFFVVMMLDINLERVREGFWRNLPLALVVGGIMVLEMVAVLANRYHGAVPRDFLPRLQQHQGARPRALYAVRLRLRDRRGAAARRDHRRDRAHAGCRRKDSRYQDPSRQVKARREERVRSSR